MKREILISPVVERELDRLLDSIAARSPAGALATLQAFRMQLELLEDPSYPDRIVSVVELSFPICRINFGRRRQFCILYRAAGPEVRIHFIGRAEQVHEGLRLEESEAPAAASEPSTPCGSCLAGHWESGDGGDSGWKPGYRQRYPGHPARAGIGSIPFEKCILESMNRRMATREELK